METDNSSVYYRDREQRALSMANGAVDGHIRRIHLEMAAEYGRLAALTSQRVVPLMLVTG